MLFNKISILTEDFKIQKNMYVGTIGEKIAYISEFPPEPEEAYKYGNVYKNCHGKLLMPGFYNSHTHIPMTILRGYGENLNLNDWLHKRIFPFEAKLTGEYVYWSTLLGLAESLKFGIVCNNDMYMHINDMCKAYTEAGVKGNINDAFTCFDRKNLQDLYAYGNSIELMQEYNSKNSGRVQVEFGLHAEYTSTEKIVRQLAEACKEHNSPIHVHVSESKAEVEECKKRRLGRSPVEYFKDLGLFDVRATAAHCVHIDERDAAILAKKNVTISTNPISNLKLASGVMPAKIALEAGVNISIGTDGVASNNNLNYFEDMKFYSLVQKGFSGDPTLVTPAQALHAATRGGAIATGRLDCGVIKEGYKADMIMLDIDKPYMMPSENLVNHLVYAGNGGDIVMTIVDGEILYEEGEYTTIDIKKVSYEVERAYKNITSRI